MATKKTKTTKQLTQKEINLLKKREQILLQQGKLLNECIVLCEQVSKKADEILELEKKWNVKKG